MQLSSTDLTNSIQILNDLLAHSYSLYLKTQNAHWNVQGPSFYMLHLLFESQYQSLQNAIDEIAERIRTLDGVIEASFQKFHQKSGVKECADDYKDRYILNVLVNDHDYMIQHIRDLLKKIEKYHDDGTKDLLTSRLKDHEKMHWFLKSHIKFDNK